MGSFGGLAIIFASFLCLFLMMALQGIRDPPYRLIHGTTKEIFDMRKEVMGRSHILSHDTFSVVQPHRHAWIKIYGKNYLQWHGSQAQLVIRNPTCAKRYRITKIELPKREIANFVNKLLGDGLVATTEAENGGNSSAETMLERWKDFEGQEIEVYEEFRLFTSEVISRTAFGSSYIEGKNIFDMLIKIGSLIFKNSLKVRVPGISKFFKTSDEIESDKLEIESVKKREKKARPEEKDSFGSDFLGLLLKARHNANDNHRILVDELIDECKTYVFLFGYLCAHNWVGFLLFVVHVLVLVFVCLQVLTETTNTSLAWTVLLLALHTDWQEEARKEMTMIINESLRLYTPSVSLIRKAEREVKLGKLIIPANLELVVSTIAPHQDPKIWGQDVHLFKQDRFSEWVLKATNNNVGAFIPFGLGPRTYVGLNFATTEAKIALSMILQRYSFTLSPGYVHLPLHYISVRPHHGVQVILLALNGEDQSFP
ncbi:unnamed protein product [Malus baccata var. baccata]